jgi:hypothetical protein
MELIENKIWKKNFFFNYFFLDKYKDENENKILIYLKILNLRILKKFY